MEDIDSSPALPTSPNPLKRAAPDDTPGKKPLNLKGSQFMMATPPDTEESSNASPGAIGSLQPQRAASPALSISTMSSVDLASIAPADNSKVAHQSGLNPPPAKKRKLSPSEKLEKQREKEAKERDKAERKAQKEEERRVKEEERRVKDEEKRLRDEERRARDEEKRLKAEEREAKKREKEVEEQQKVEAKLKKERSQMRLGAFFGAKPGTPAKSPGPRTSGSARRKSLSLEPYEAVADQLRNSVSPTKGAQAQVNDAKHEARTPAQSEVPDYRKYFLPFELPTHSTLAQSFQIPNPDDLAYWQGAFDEELNEPSYQEKIDLGLLKATAALDHMFDTRYRDCRGLRQPNLKALIEKIEGTSQKQPIDLTQDVPLSQSQAPIHALHNVPRRHIQFNEDVRPAYFGTYTKVRSPQMTRKIMLNPFSRTRPDTDYDYDSEAEWEEPEEGEDILGDEEDEAESVGEDDEMDGFLDDRDDAQKNKRKRITSDLQPTSTGLCWENETNAVMQSVEREEVLGTPKDMQGMRMGFLLPGFTGQTIDPFSTTYWVNDMAPPALPLTEAQRTNGPGRPPLQERHSNGPLSQSLVGAAQGEKGPITAVSATCSNATPQHTPKATSGPTTGAKRGPKAQPRTLSNQDLEEFKEAVVGSNLKKIDLCKALKIRFPKMTNETIKDTLSSQFAHVGAGKAVDKKWVFVNAS